MCCVICVFSQSQSHRAWDCCVRIPSAIHAPVYCQRIRGPTNIQVEVRGAPAKLRAPCHGTPYGLITFRLAFLLGMIPLGKHPVDVRNLKAAVHITC